MSHFSDRFFKKGSDIVMLMASLRDLEVRHLVAFDAVAKEGTFGRAAEKLGYTQSAISQQIAALERLVDGKLFDRPGGPKPVELTPLGEQMLVSARELLARVDAVAVDLDRFRTGEVGRITVGTYQSVSAKVLPMVVGRMRAEYPEVEIRVFESDLDDELDQALSRGELDLSFVVGDWVGQFESQPLFADPFVLVARPGDFKPGAVRLSELDGVPMVGQHANSCQLMNEMGLRAAGLEPNYVFRTNDNGTVSAMVKAGLGFAVMPLLCVEPNDPGLALHALRPALPDRRISIAWRKGRTLSPVAQRFVELAREESVVFVDRTLPAKATTAA
jgi:DNA-binding transcriptional LysR family regulator